NDVSTVSLRVPAVEATRLNASTFPNACIWFITLQAYARQRNDIDMEIWTSEIKLRAHVRIGELTSELETYNGSRTDLSPLSSGEKRLKTTVLRDAGISTVTAHRCEQIAKIPRQDFEEYIQKKRTKRQAII